MLLTVTNLLAVPLAIGFPINRTLEASGGADSVSLGVSERDLIQGEDQGDPAYKRLNLLRQEGSISMSTAEDSDSSDLLEVGTSSRSVLGATLDTIVSATAEIVRAVVKTKGLLTEVTLVASAALTTGDLTLTLTRNGGSSLGVLTAVQAASAIGDVTTLVLATPELVEPDDVLELLAGGANDATGKGEVSFKIEPRTSN